MVIGTEKRGGGVGKREMGTGECEEERRIKFPVLFLSSLPFTIRGLDRYVLNKVSLYTLQ